MNAKSWLELAAGIATPVGGAVTGTPWWVIVTVLALLLVHRVLPWTSKDLLTLWLRILPSRDRRPPTKRDRQPPAERDHRPPTKRDRQPPAERDHRPPTKRDRRLPTKRDRRLPAKRDHRPPTKKDDLGDE